MNRFGRIVLALTLVFTFVLTAAAGLWVVRRLNDGTESAEEYVPMPTPSFVSLNTVGLINSRARTLMAVTTAAVSTSGEMQFTMDTHTDLTYENTQLGDIPMLEVYRDNGKKQPLLLFLHGLGNDKESVIQALTAFAEAGYHAVGVDAFNQGERYSANTSCDTWAAMLITVGDIDPIIEYFRTVKNVDTDSFVIGGFSMGAVEAMAYVESGSYKPAAVIALCGMCELNAWQPWQQQSITYGWLSSWKDSVWTFPEDQEFWYTGEKYETITSMNVTNNLASFAGIPVLCCIGTADKYFNARTVRNVTQQLAGSGSAASCIVYPGGTHEITNRMLADSVAFLENVTGISV